MSDKALRKRQYIIEKAHDIFAKKGYRDVTMKDIVEACEISRGGLYLYFSSTEELFLEVIKQEQDDKNKKSEKADLKSCTPGELLLFFLKEKKKEILSGSKGLVVAKCEYAFVCKGEKKATPYKAEFEKEIMVLAKILSKGNESKEFMCESPTEEAGHIMFALEGLKLCANTMGISENRIDRELVYIMKRFVIQD